MESTTVLGKYTCDMPVLIGEVKYMSHGVAITATVMTYYFFSTLWTNGGHQSNPDGYAFQFNKYSWTVLGSFIGVSLLQFLMLTLQQQYGKCSVSLLGFLASWGIGVLIGGIGFTLIWAWDRAQLPYFQEPETFTNLAFKGGFGAKRPESLVKDPAKKESDDAQQSHKMDDKDEFVCDLYKNGQLITSTISE